MRMLRNTIAVMGLVSFAAVVGAAEPDRALQLNITSQPVGDALNEFARQSGLQVVMDPAEAQGVKAQELVGEFTARTALEKLLANTGLRFEYLNERTVAVRGFKATQGKTNPEIGLSRGGEVMYLVQADGAPGMKDAGVAGQDGLDEVVVSGYRFLNEDTSGTTNLPLPIEKVPQSISLISSDFLKAADIKTLGEVAQYTPGAVFSGNKLNRRTDVKLRGFSSGEAVDGLPLPLSGAEYDYAVVERLEIVKGPSSVVYGAASPGGLLNVVTKEAAPDTAEYLLLTAGMWNEYRIEGQMGGAVGTGDRINAIGVAAYEKGDSFMETVGHDRTVLYGGLNFCVTDESNAYLRAGFEGNGRTGFDGVPMYADGTLAPVPRTFFIGSGDPRFELKSDKVYVIGGIDWDLTDLWQLSFKGNYTRIKNKGMVPYAEGLQENGDTSLSIFGSFRDSVDAYSVGVSSVYKLDKFGLRDSFISMSGLYSDRSSDGVYLFVPNFATANVFDGVRSISSIFDAVVFPDDSYTAMSDDRILSYSAQAVLRVMDPLTLLLGASYAGTENEFGESNSSVARFKYDGELSYRAGVTYEAAPGLNAYLSYSESFQPQTQRDVDYRPLAPLVGQQKEVGVKYAPPGARLLFTAAAYEIIQNNKPEFDQITPLGDAYRAVGEVRHRGAEFEIVGQLADRWQLHAGYAYLDPVVTKNQNRPQVVGKTITYLPKNTASAFANYKMSNNLTVGAGVRYVDSVKTMFDRSTRDLPAYTILDATAAYNWNNWMFQLNLHNFLDEKYYINTWETAYYGNVVGEPMNVSVSVRRDF